MFGSRIQTGHCRWTFRSSNEDCLAYNPGMNFSTGGIIALIVIALHIIASVAKYAEKKKKEDAVRRALESRRTQDTGVRVGVPGSGGATGATSGSSPFPSAAMAGTSIGSPVSGQARVDDVAARRQAQLEQLRQRRESRRASSIGRPPEPAARSSGHGPLTAPSQTVPEMRQGMRIEDGSHPQTVLRDAQSARQRELRARQQAQDTQIAQDREQRSDARKRIERAKQAAIRKSTENQPAEVVNRSEKGTSDGSEMTSRAKATSADPYRLTAGRDLVSTLNTQLRHPASLRQFLVLKEILDRPLSLR